MTKEGKIFDIEDRLIDFAAQIIGIVRPLSKTSTGKHIAGQILRSGTSPAANYGEAQSAESHADFMHKMKICLKELRETRIWLRIIIKANIVNLDSAVENLIDENNQLISIFVASLKTAKQKRY
jgi:four helix bundle protein